MTAELQKALQGVGASKTIYALVMPETEAVKNRIFDGEVKQELERLIEATGSLIDADAIIAATHRARAPYLKNFREAWTQKQDIMHEEFFATWREWAKPIADVSKEIFNFEYPTAGASEGLRAMIDHYGHRSRAQGFAPEIHLFKGEYEGFSAYADAAQIPVIWHDRNRWREAVDTMGKSGKPVQFYLSQPSALDGNVWEDYDGFMQRAAENAPNAETIVDLTYVGCVARDFSVNTDYPTIPAVVFSLSKPIGGYYDRIGGVLARGKASDGAQGPLPSLFGNIWFKNLTSLAIGTGFMKTHGVQELPRKYAEVQKQAIAAIEQNLLRKEQAGGTPFSLGKLRPSDVFLLATAEIAGEPGRLEKYLSRACDGKTIARVCLTPTMAEMIGTAKTHEVEPRYYER